MQAVLLAISHLVHVDAVVVRSLRSLAANHGELLNSVIFPSASALHYRKDFDGLSQWGDSMVICDK